MDVALRQRIIDAMPEIEEIIDNENRGIGTGGECCDVRPAVVWSIKGIAELKTMTASEERAKLEKAAERLRQAKKLLEEIGRVILWSAMSMPCWWKSKQWNHGPPAGQQPAASDLLQRMPAT